MKEYYDFSNYPKDHLMYSEENKAVPGKMKDETAGVVVAEFVGIGAKVYSLITIEDERKMTCKGVGKTAAKGITHEQYRNCVLNLKAKGVTDDPRRQKTKMPTDSQRWDPSHLNTKNMNNYERLQMQNRKQSSKPEVSSTTSLLSNDRTTEKTKKKKKQQER